MTRMLLRVADAGEAALAAAAGVDLVEFRLAPHADAPDMSAAQAIRAAFDGRLRLRIDGASIAPEIVAAATDARADELAMPANDVLSRIFDHRGPTEDVALIAEVTATPDARDLLRCLGGRAQAIMFVALPGGRLLDLADVAQLDALAAFCRARGLAFGFAGGLEAPDVARLLLLEPDVLAFDAAVRLGLDPAGPLDPGALDAIRALLPRDTPAIVPKRRLVTDRMFVRNFVVALSIGAYQAEHGARQRVRFSVEADVAREPALPRDMRDVFSYDIIIETIRVLAGRAHVTFVETLAEEVAAALLAQPSVLSTTVKVEKLDVIDGEVGIEIRRRRET